MQWGWSDGETGTGSAVGVSVLCAVRVPRYSFFGILVRDIQYEASIQPLLISIRWWLVELGEIYLINLVSALLERFTTLVRNDGNIEQRIFHKEVGEVNVNLQDFVWTIAFIAYHTF